LREGTVDKRYQVLVRGRVRWSERVVDVALDRYATPAGERRVRVAAAGRAATTIFRVLQKFGDADPPQVLLEAQLLTGRTHQIRVHLAHLALALAGDDKYGDFEWNRALGRSGLARMFLHAHRIRFAHPKDGRAMEIEAPLPVELERYLATLRAAPAKSRG
jgi:23S rRNA pseudouridine955/2504/2580 synthase